MDFDKTPEELKEALEKLSPDGSGLQPELYTAEEMECVEAHIQQYFGPVDKVFHEIVSPDIHVDICLIPPQGEHDYYTLVTMGMGAHRMNVPEELTQYKLERAELVIALPPHWKLTEQDFEDECWYWPVRLLKTLARFPGNCDTWLGFGHTLQLMQDQLAPNTKLCAALLASPLTLNDEDDDKPCVLPNGDEVNFYQVIPLYKEELEFAQSHDTEETFEKMQEVSYVVDPARPCAVGKQHKRFRFF